MTNSNPSLNPSNNSSLAGTLNTVFSKLLQNVDGMLPAQVEDYDRDSNRARVKILIALLTTDNQRVSRPVIASVPVLLLGGGGYLISYPLKQGDLGWIAASDRDISLFLKNYQENIPNTYRVKSFSDGIFIPDVMHNYSISQDDADDLVIQSTDGATKITVGANKININADDVTINATKVDIDAGQIAVPGAATLTIGTGIEVLNITGSLLVTGTVHATNIP